MGIKGLKKYIKTCIFTKEISNYSNKKVAIDTSIFLYKFKYGGNNFLKSFKKQIDTLKKNNIFPIYVFDCSYNELKQETITDRRDKYIVLSNKIKDLEDKLNSLDIQVIEGGTDNRTKSALPEATQVLSPLASSSQREGFISSIENLQKQSIKVSKEDTENLKKLFDLCGINYIDSEPGYDAECICSNLCKDGVVDAVISNDIDSLAYGSIELIVNFNNANNVVESIKLEDVLEFLELEYSSFIRMCLLMGCDFFKGEFKYGPVKSHKAVKEGKFITENYNELMKIFTTPGGDYSGLQFENKEISDSEKIKKFINEWYP
jgi:5'-3' exonuclease